MKGITVLFCLLFSGLAAAQSLHSGKHYTIELLVFQNLAPSDDGETWPLAVPESLEPDFEDGTLESAQTLAAPQSTVQWLTATGLALDKEAGAINRSSRYRRLAYYAWRQPVPDRNLATSLALPASQPTRTGAWVDGEVSVSVGRYLHLELDLRFHDPQLFPAVPSANPVETSGDGNADTALPPGEEPAAVYDEPVIVLREERRMRSNELHYFDNPRFAVLAIITPYADASESDAPSGEN